MKCLATVHLCWWEESSKCWHSVCFFFSFYVDRDSTWWSHPHSRQAFSSHTSLETPSKTTPGVVAPGWFHICQWILTTTSIENSLSKGFSSSECSVTLQFLRVLLMVGLGFILFSLLTFLHLSTQLFFIDASCDLTFCPRSLVFWGNHCSIY